MIPVAVRQRPAYDDQLDEPAALTVRVDCPAKTNLTLEVGPTHDEWGGRHELDTIYCAIGVYDTITATAKHPGAGFSLELEARIWAIWPHPAATCAATTRSWHYSPWPRRPAAIPTCH